MYRSSPSARLLRQSITTARASRSCPSTRRFLTTEPPHKTSRSWKNSATRWALAAGGIYWYNTSPIFNEQPQYTVQEEEPPLPTLESLSKSARFSPPSDQDLPTLPSTPSQSSPPSLDPKSNLPGTLDEATQSPADLESEAASQGAFNEETGEINWDCPCLGGMAHGPCGPEFREAFSCFVFSKEEPKGMDCVDKFKGMQTCFRAHPEEYGDQLEEDEEEVEREIAAQELAKQGGEGGANVGNGGEGVSSAAGGGVVTAVKEELGQAVGEIGSVGADAAKAVKEAVVGDGKEKKKEKRSIYDNEESTKKDDSKKSTQQASAKKTASEQSSKTSDSSTGATAGSSKSEKGIAGDEGGDLVPKAAHDAT